MDYRDLAGEPFDAIASIGMVEHVGSVNIDAYFAKLASLVRPGGRILNHGIARLRLGDAEAGPFSERYVFPDAAPLHLSRIQTAVERAGLHTIHVEDFPDDYARTLLEWQRRFEANIDRARELAGDERVRVWRIYLRVSRQGFESGFMSPYQVLSAKGSDPFRFSFHPANRVRSEYLKGSDPWSPRTLKVGHTFAGMIASPPGASSSRSSTSTGPPAARSA